MSLGKGKAVEVVDTEQVDNLKEIQETLKKQKKYAIRIPSTETQREPVEVGVCGYVYRIKRDEWVEVPEAVVEVLNNAQFTYYTQKRREDGDGNELIPHTVQRFAYQVRSFPA